MIPTNSGGRFSADQQALVALAKEAKALGRGGYKISASEAQTLLTWARELGLKALDDIKNANNHWVGGPHIQIGPIDHIPVNP